MWRSPPPSPRVASCRQTSLSPLSYPMRLLNHNRILLLRILLTLLVRIPQYTPIHLLSPQMASLTTLHQLPLPPNYLLLHHYQKPPPQRWYRQSRLLLIGVKRPSKIWLSSSKYSVLERRTPIEITMVGRDDPTVAKADEVVAAVLNRFHQHYTCSQFHHFRRLLRHLSHISVSHYIPISISNYHKLGLSPQSMRLSSS